MFVAVQIVFVNVFLKPKHNCLNEYRVCFFIYDKEVQM